MEDVLEVYQRPYDPCRPVICLDETSRQLIEQTRPSLPMRPGESEKVDHEYRRNGVVNLFMMFEPLSGQRHVEVRETRNRKDFAHSIRLLVEKYYPASEKIVLVMDHLNTHAISSLYETYPPQEALRLANKLEIHYTPKHGSWLDMAEIEIGIMKRQCLGKYTITKEEMEGKVAAWCKQRNEAKATVNWQFTTADARIKLMSLYPVIVETNFMHY